MAGLYYEEFKIGMIFDHAMHRTITEADNVLFTTMTHNPSALHLDAEYMKKSQYGRPLVNSCLTLSMMTGISIADTTLGTTMLVNMANNVRFPKPLFQQHFIRIQTGSGCRTRKISKPDKRDRRLSAVASQPTW